MTNTDLCSNWTGFSASIPGSGHIRRGLPCQDASTAFTTPRPALIVCDGRGSATASQDGAQGAVQAFQSQLNIFEPMLAAILDTDNGSPAQWEQFARIMYRTLMQVKLDLAQKQQLPEKEFDFTVAFAVLGTKQIGCFQVGDGAIVLRQNGQTMTAFPPDKGEFANQTHFLREGGETRHKFHAALFSAQDNTGIAITSDGPEHLMFKLSDMTPGRIFNEMLNALHGKSLCKQDIMDYLTRREWENDPRGGDDRSIAILAPVVYPDGQTDTAAIPAAPISDTPEQTPEQTADQTEPAPQEPTEADVTAEQPSPAPEQTAEPVDNQDDSDEQPTPQPQDGTPVPVVPQDRMNRLQKILKPIFAAVALFLIAGALVYEELAIATLSRQNEKLSQEVAELKQDFEQQRQQLTSQDNSVPQLPSTAESHEAVDTQEDTRLKQDLDQPRQHMTTQENSVPPLPAAETPEAPDEVETPDLSSHPDLNTPVSHETVPLNQEQTPAAVIQPLETATPLQDNDKLL